MSQSSVLVVEDDESLREMIEWVLSEEGYSVATAADGVAALDFVQRERPHLILLDMRMPVLDGWGFAQAYRQLPVPHAPILVVTAARDAASRSAEVDAAGFLAKPFQVEELTRLIKLHWDDQVE